MMIDPQDDMVVDPTENETDQVAIIEPDQLDNDAEHLENVTMATDCMCCPIPHVYMAILPAVGLH